MIRTRDLLIIVVSIILTMIVALGAVVLSPEPQRAVTTSQEEVKFSTPKDSYSVAPYEEENTLRDDREAFIEKVKQTYIPPKVTLPDKDDSIQSAPEQNVQTTLTKKEESIPETVPPVEVPSTPIDTPVTTTGTTTYGNTGL